MSNSKLGNQYFSTRQSGVEHMVRFLGNDTHVIQNILLGGQFEKHSLRFSKTTGNRKFAFPSHSILQGKLIFRV